MLNFGRLTPVKNLRKERTKVVREWPDNLLSLFAQRWEAIHVFKKTTIAASRRRSGSLPTASRHGLQSCPCRP